MTLRIDIIELMTAGSGFLLEKDQANVGQELKLSPWLKSTFPMWC